MGFQKDVYQEIYSDNTIDKAVVILNNTFILCKQFDKMEDNFQHQN